MVKKHNLKVCLELVRDVLPHVLITTEAVRKDQHSLPVARQRDVITSKNEIIPHTYGF